MQCLNQLHNVMCNVDDDVVQLTFMHWALELDGHVVAQQ